MFLDSVAYYMMSGNMDGIETNYKSIMHAKREIPASSCTSEIENLLFATGEFGDEIAVEERARFTDMLHRLDERAEAYEIKKPQKQRQESRFSKRTKLGIRNGEWCRVDTDGKFWFDGHQYIIDEQEIQYQPLPTEYGDYYAMDRILAANGCFYDMNYDIVNCLPIGV
jgi:hypothetical protein